MMPKMPWPIAQLRYDVRKYIGQLLDTNEFQRLRDFTQWWHRSSSECVWTEK